MGTFEYYGVLYIGYLQVLVSYCKYFDFEVLLAFAPIFLVTSLHLAIAATASSLYCLHLSDFVGQVEEVDRVKEVRYKV